jgi:hypothetical protein
MQNNTLAIVFVLIIVVLGIGGYLLFFRGAQVPDTSAITSFEECVAAGYPVMESYPRRCAANGQTFVEDIGNEFDKADLIRVDTPRPNELVGSPLTVTGEARGYWYFEASFPIEVRDAEGELLAIAPAQAQGEWMTEEFVPFEITLDFQLPKTDTGTLILHKDNPSGLPEHDDSLSIPIRFR